MTRQQAGEHVGVIAHVRASCVGRKAGLQDADPHDWSVRVVDKA
jgi:hypothetical protein